MIKNILLSIALLSFIITPAAAQSFHAEINYQSFRPFLNFRIELGSYDRYQHSSYQTAYLKGYMDGVNHSYYSSYRFYDLVHNIRAYEAGYRDGIRDQRLYYRLRGWQHAPRRFFSYDDYYSPYYSVQVWLSQLSFTFISVPDRRLPHHWARRIHPRVKEYRHRFNERRYHKKYRKQHRKRVRQLKKRSRKYQQKYRSRRNASGKRKYSRSKLNRKKAIKRVKNRSRDLGVDRSRSSRPKRVRSRGARTGQERSRCNSRVKKRSQSSGAKKVRSRSRSRGSKGKVKPSHSRRSKGKSRSRGNSRSETGAGTDEALTLSCGHPSPAGVRRNEV